jgi:predicted thioesterase
MNDKLQPGLLGTVHLEVKEEHTARQVASGQVDVLATPVMVGLMEEASVNAVHKILAPGKTTVGLHLDVKHIAATPIGLLVEARAELTAVDGNRLTFRVEAHDPKEQIGIGTHRRVIVGLDDFQKRAQEKTKV